MMKAIISTSDEEIAEIRNQNIIANVLDLDAIVQLKSALQEASKKLSSGCTVWRRQVFL